MVKINSVNNKDPLKITSYCHWAGIISVCCESHLRNSLKLFKHYDVKHRIPYDTFIFIIFKWGGIYKWNLCCDGSCSKLSVFNICFE